MPPYGMSFLLMLRLAGTLSRDFDVLICESAGCPDGDCAVVDEDFTLGNQARWVADMLAGQGFDAFHFVGWCQAAQIVAHAIATLGLKPLGMTWIAPSGFGYAVVKSEFDRCALPIYMEIGRLGIVGAEKLSRILDKYRDDTGEVEQTGERLTMLHLRDTDATLVFSRYMKQYDQQRAEARGSLSASLRGIPTQILHCRDDTYSHFSESVGIVRDFPEVELKLSDSGGHLQVFDAFSEPADQIVRFIRRSTACTA